MLSSLLGSKKFLAALVAAALQIAESLFPDLNLREAGYAVMSYVVGQGIADNGKEAVRERGS